jgi:hypothetical protein
MKRIHAMALALSIGFAAPLSLAGHAHAQTVTNGASPQRLALGYRLLEAMQIGKQVDTVLNSMLPMMLAQQEESLSESDQALIGDITRESLAAMMPRIMAGMAEQYALIFTPEEMQGLTDFYTGPLGQSLLAKQPKLAPAATQVMQALMPELQADMVRRVCKRMKCDAPERRSTTGA